MAFQAPALPFMATTVSELLSTRAANTPWRTYRGAQSRTEQGRNTIEDTSSSIQFKKQVSNPVLPECLRDLHASSFYKLSTPVVAPRHTSIRDSISAMPRGTLAAANPIARRAFLRPSVGRQMSTVSAFRFQRTQQSFTQVTKQQQRTIFASNTSRNLLAHMEETANKNPTSATAQNAFYQALLRANMGAIVVERYQTGQFASNAACEKAYHSALTGLQSGGDGQGNAMATQGLTSAQIQAIGQAVAASAKGGNIAVANGQRISGSTGDSKSPVHVVVEETIGVVLFKWVKFIAYFGLVCWLCMGGISLLAEMLGGALGGKGRLSGKTDNEAKAEHQKVRFSDVHGCDEAKEELQEVVDFLKNPEKFSTLGGKLPKGVLLVGPPGTGKTLLARAVAGEAGVPFFFMSGSEFDEIYVGVGAKRVRELFASAKSKQPAIIFIDELDAIGGKRNARDAQYVKQTLNQLLTELDGFEQNSGVIILGATNFPESLDKALTRPGRFDRNVVVGLPDVRGRIAILKHHMKGILAGKDVDIQTLAMGTPGFSGAELENVINQAAVHASKAKATAVSMLDFEWAKDKVIMGSEKKSMVISPHEKEMTAYHEAGHALVCMFTKGANELHKITVMPRGQSLGMTSHLPAIDKYSMSMNEYLAHIDVCLGGKIAEELQYGGDNVTSGVASDLQQATQIAYSMVTRFGMSEKLGNVDLDSNHSKLSSETKQVIESEVRRTIEEGRVRATQLLISKKKELDLLARALVDYETLNKEEAYKVIKGEKLAGRIAVPPRDMKLPESPGPSSNLGGINGIPGISPIPGSGEQNPPPAPPPQGGLAA